MIRIFLGVFVVLHGLVHLLYYGQSARYFELRPGMVWPDRSWISSNFFGELLSRNLASGLLVAAALGLVASGAGIFLGKIWWRPALAGSVILSSLIFILFWDGTIKELDNQGAIGILINAAILVTLLVFQKLNFDL
jgi:uncharacterized membrane protein YphA (DoxX/SURF4 family)